MNSVKDWKKNADNFDFPDDFNKPVGCCRKNKNDKSLDGDDEKVLFANIFQSSPQNMQYFSVSMGSIITNVTCDMVRVNFANKSQPPLYSLGHSPDLTADTGLTLLLCLQFSQSKLHQLPFVFPSEPQTGE